MRSGSTSLRVVRKEERGLEVLDAVGGVFQAAGFAAALALVGRVVGEGDEAVSARSRAWSPEACSLTPLPVWPTTITRHRQAWLSSGVWRGLAGERDAGAVGGDVGLCHASLSGNRMSAERSAAPAVP